MRTQRRLTAAITLGLYVLSAVLFPHAAEANFWAERRNAVVRDSSLTARYPANAGNELLSSFPALNRVTQSPALSSSVVENLPKGFADKYAPLLNALPPQYGSIRKVSLPLTDPRAESSEPRVVIHIQDVHRNREAQENIAAAVQELINHDQAGLVALEGAFEPMDLKRFREFPRKDTMKIVADEMLAKDEISGPVHTALLSAHEIPAVEGVDDPRSYDANVAAYRRSVILQPDYKARIADAEKSLAREEEGIFHAALKEFDAQVDAYRRGKLSLGDYARSLSRVSGRVRRVLTLFLRALEMERSLNFKRVEEERSRVVEELARKMSRADMTALLERSEAYRSGSVRYAEFYRFLRGLCQRNGVSLQGRPELDRYIQYVLLADGIDSGELFKEIVRSERSAYDRLAKTPEERRLIQESKRLFFAGKLLDFALTPDEWAECKRAAGGRWPAGMDLSSFEVFYKEAELRSEAMSRNLLSAMERTGSRTAVLVTGGFHTEEMEELLKQQGCAVITFTPKITEVDADKGSAYLGIFTREKTPLQNILEGEKLFLAHAPLDRGQAALGIAADAYAVGGFSDAISSLADPKVRERIVEADRKILGGLARVTVRMKSGRGLVTTYDPGKPKGERLSKEEEKTSKVMALIWDVRRNTREYLFALPGVGLTTVVYGLMAAGLIPQSFFGLPTFTILLLAGLTELLPMAWAFLRIHSYREMERADLRRSRRGYYWDVLSVFLVFGIAAVAIQAGGLSLFGLHAGLLGKILVPIFSAAAAYPVVGLFLHPRLNINQLAHNRAPATADIPSKENHTDALAKLASVLSRQRANVVFEKHLPTGRWLFRRGGIDLNADPEVCGQLGRVLEGLGRVSVLLALRDQGTPDLRAVLERLLSRGGDWEEAFARRGVRCSYDYKKVLLVAPYGDHEGRRLRYAFPHNGLELLAYRMRRELEDVDVQVYNPNLTGRESLYEFVRSGKFDVVGVSVLQTVLKANLEILGRLSLLSPSSLIVAGGADIRRFPLSEVFASFPVNVLAFDNGDSLVRLVGVYHPGAPLSSLREVPNIAYSHDGQIQRTKTLPAEGKMPADWSVDIPYEGADLIHGRHYDNPKTTGRGVYWSEIGSPPHRVVFGNKCRGRCIFCRLARGTRENLTAQETVREIRRAPAGTRGVLLQASDLFHSPPEAEQVLKAIAADPSARAIPKAATARVVGASAELLHLCWDAGFEYISFGVESFDDPTLEKLGKGSNAEDNFRAIEWALSAGVKAGINLIFFTPWDTVSSTLDTLAVAVEYASRGAYLNVVPYLSVGFGLPITRMSDVIEYERYNFPGMKGEFVFPTRGKVLDEDLAMAARESLGTLPLLLERENSGTFSEGSPAVYSLYVCKAFLISLERLGIPTPGFSVPRLLAKVNEVIEKIKVAEGMSSKELPDPSARGPVEDIADFFNGVALKISLLAEDGGHVVLRYQNLQPEVSRGERIPRYMVYDILSGPERSYRGYVTLTTDGQKVQSSQINFRHGKGDAFLSRCIGDFLREPEKYLLNSARSGVQSFNPEDPRLRRSYRSGMDDISIGEPGLSNGWNVTFGAGSRGGVADAVKAAYEPGTVETWGARLGVRGAIRFFRVLRAPLVEEIFGGFFIAKSSKSRLPLGHGVLPILGGVAAYALGGMNVAVWVYSLAFLASRIPFVFARHASPLQRLDAAVISLLALGFSFGLLMAGEFSLPAAGAALGFKLISHILVNFATVRVTREEELAYTVSQALRAQTLSRVEAAKMIQRNLRGNRLDLQIGETFDPDAAVEGLMAQAVKSQNDPAFLGTLAHALRSGDVPAGQLEGLFDSLMGRGRPVLSAAAIMNADGLPSLRNPFTLRVVRGGAAEADAASADLTASHRDADGRWRGLAVVVTDDRAVAERFSSRKEGDLLVVLAAEEEQPPATELHYMTLPRRKVFSSASGVEFLSLSAVEGTVRERLASFEARTGSITSSWFILPPGLPVLAEDYATDAFRQAVVIRLLDMLGGVRMTLQELRFLGRTLEAVASSA